MVKEAPSHEVLKVTLTYVKVWKSKILKHSEFPLFMLVSLQFRKFRIEVPDET